MKDTTNETTTTTTTAATVMASKRIVKLLAAQSALMDLFHWFGDDRGLDLANQLEREAHTVWSEEGMIDCPTHDLSIISEKISRSIYDTTTTTTTTTTAVAIKLANYASTMKCSILMDGKGDLCLFERFWDDEGKRVIRLAPSEGAYRPESEWLAAIAARNAGKMIA